MKETLLPPHAGIMLCGGLGTRFSALTEDRIVKPLFKVAGKELIRYSLDSMDPAIISCLVFAIAHGSDQIVDWVNRSEFFDRNVYFSTQVKPGVLEAISQGLNTVNEDSIVTCNTDEIRTNINLVDIVKFHNESKTLATVVAAYADSLFRHKTLTVRGSDNRILSTELNPSKFKTTPEARGLVNAGILIMDRRAFEYADPSYNKDWSGLMDPLCDAGQLSAYIIPKMRYFNVGTPEEFYDAETKLKEDS